MSRSTALFTLLITLLLVGCAAKGGTGTDGGGSDTGLGDGSTDTSVDSTTTPDTTPGDGSPTDTPADTRIDREAFCMGRGPVVTVGDSTMMTDTCAGAIASRVFDHALCSCTDTNIVGYLRTRSFDSGMGAMDTAAGAPVGVNGNYLTGGYAEVGGTFVVAGTGGVDFGGYLEVGGDAMFGGNLRAIGVIDIGRDLWVGGDVTHLGTLDVARDFYRGGSVLTFPDIGGSTISGSFTVDPPCACGATELVDIDAIVAAGMAENDNADVGLDPRSLENVVGLGVDITLPCGRYYITSIGGLGSIDLHVPGRTALFVDGDVDALGVFDIDLGPEGELDMFVRGDLLSVGAGSYGDRSRPAATRIYVGGSGDVTIVGAAGFVGNVYAPNARITAVGATTVYGSLFGRQIDMPGYLQVSYDRAILNVDRDCPPPDVCGCGAGDGCPDHRACVSGTCAACTSDDDCCGALVCYPDGTCGPLLF